MLCLWSSVLLYREDIMALKIGMIILCVISVGVLARFAYLAWYDKELW